jgi:S1-C subfamily serine protease
MNDQPISRRAVWWTRWVRFREFVRKSFPFASGVLAALAALLIYNLLAPGPQPLTAREVQDTVASAMASATPRPAFSARAYQVIQPSLILVQTESPGIDGEIDRGLGSGVVINFDGDILTSLHVIAAASEIRVTFADGTQSAAQIVFQEPESDTAVLRAEKLPDQIFPATLGNPNSLRVGDEAYAVGNPFGLYSSMSAGVISGFDRSFQPPGSDISLQGLIQIDTAVNPGNSGGPLVNRNGQVVGIIVGIVNPTEESFFIGIGFAVPINAAGGGFGSPPY